MNTPQPVDTLLAIDIGNTRIGMGIWDSDGLHDVQRVAADHPKTWSAALEKTWTATSHGHKRAVVIGSVAPDQTRLITPLIEKVCGEAPLSVRTDLPLPIDLEIENPHEIGVDRICCAAAAYERIEGACAIASFGTATTIDCVSPGGHFIGGVILPGLEMSCKALHEHTAQLPHVKPNVPKSPFGRNTPDAIVSGVSYAAVGALREIVERFATELGEWPHLVITGGSASIVGKLADFVDAIVPDLCLMGIALTYRKAAGQE